MHYPHIWVALHICIILFIGSILIFSAFRPGYPAIEESGAYAKNSQNKSKIH